MTASRPGFYRLDEPHSLPWPELALRYMALIQPERLAQVKPAKPGEIERLLEVSAERFPFGIPQDYLDYLTCMGADYGDLTRALQADLSVGRAIELYLETPSFEFPEDAYLIGAGWESAFIPEVCLWPSGADSPQVWTAGAEERIEYIARSFKDLVLQPAFLGYDANQFNFQFRFGLSEEQRLGEVRQWATAAFAFEAYEFSDDKTTLLASTQ